MTRRLFSVFKFEDKSRSIVENPKYPITQFGTDAGAAFAMLGIGMAVLNQWKSISKKLAKNKGKSAAAVAVAVAAGVVAVGDE